MSGFRGAWPALVTPFTQGDQVNVPVLKDLTEYLMGKGVAGFYVCGSTGQGVYMSVAERKLVTEVVVDQVRGQVPVLAHVGCLALGDAIELAQHAQQVGAAGISSIIPPGYTDIASTSHYFAKLAASVPDLPFLPYLISMTIDPVALIQALHDIPNLAGTKYTGPNMYQFRQVVEARNGVWSVFSGMDEQCIFAAMFGASGNIGSTLNVMPRIYQEIHKSYQAGDLTRGSDLQRRANQVTEVLIAFGFHGALKGALDLLGFPCGQPRLPAPSLAEDKRETLRAQLEAVDFFEVVEM